jgi:asparagine synthase (glutamine-hydrolysing)
MCGIAGIWQPSRGSNIDLETQCRAMITAIAYRGPDGDGHWIDPEVGIALGHRRLAIVDLSPTGVQPMASADGRFIITYNGELYNTAEMAADLAMPFRGTSDTEVLVETLAKFGVDATLAKANGIFAFAAFDRKNRTLHLARDRLGVKPLYWMRQNRVIAFASELKALRAVKGLSFALDRESMSLYLRHACVPAPRTIYRDVCKLMPGQRLEVTERGDVARLYWDVGAVARAGQAAPDLRSEAEIAEELDGLLADSVKRQMVSDVPLGAFLSGGIDSSTVVALMQRAGRGQVKTFSIGFSEDAFNEADHARAVARHLETDHTELSFSAADAQAIIPQLPAIYDEPFADSSQLPTYLVSRLARSHVTVALSGDGGDEVFGGYVRYQGVSRLWNAIRSMPLWARQFATGAIGLLSPAAWDVLGSTVPRRFKPTHFGDKVIKGAGLLSADGPVDMYRRLISQWPDPERLLVGTREPAGWADHAAAGAGGLDAVGKLRLLDMLNYLPDDILTKVDRASMAMSLEVRVPLLDHRVVEFGWRLPSTRLIANGKGKQPLRAVLEKYVPMALVDRPKMGFGVPIGDWLRGPLRGWAEDLLSPASLAEDGLFAPAPVRARLAEHLSGRRNWQYALWTVLQFQAWRHVNR